MKLYLNFNNDLNSKDEKIKAHELLFNILNINESDIIKGKNGKPYINNNPFYFSLSHSKGNIAFIKSNREIGLDIETVREIKDIDRLKTRICNPNDLNHFKEINSKELLTIWTIKESYLKYLGIGLIMEPSKILIDYENKSVKYLNYDSINYVNGELNDIIYTVTNINEELSYEIL